MSAALVAAAFCGAGAGLSYADGAADDPEASTAPAVEAVHPAAAPPSAKEAIRAVLRYQQLPLTVHPSCEGVGTDFDDATLGDYLSGFLAELTTGTNRIDANCHRLTEAVPPVYGHDDAWACEVVVSHASGADEWRWGVRFALDAASGALIPTTVRCTGAG